jgi:queuosine precursor transporter
MRETLRPDSLTIGLFASYVISVYSANWLLFTVGNLTDEGIRTIPVAPGLDAPSGVLAAGATLTLRDAVQRRAGIPASLVAVLLGSLLSTWLSPAVALASGVAFLVAELLDMGVYTRLRRRFGLAVVGSNIVGSVVDSYLFLAIAFGSLAATTFTMASAVGKFEASLAALAFLWLIRWLLRAQSRSAATARLGTPTL